MSIREEKWFRNYDMACAYKRQFGHLNVPRTYKTPSGFRLGQWLETQRCAKRGTGAWKITAKQIKLLDKIGMNWGEETESIEKKANNSKKANVDFMEKARVFYKENGNLDFPKGSKERAWLDSLRWSASARKDMTKPPICSKDLRGRLSKKNIEELTSMGMNWNSHTYELVERRVAAIRKYKEKYGTSNIPVSYVDENGDNIGLWLARQRNNRRKTTKGIITQDTIDKLDDLEISWNPRIEKRFAEIEEWYAQNGNLNIPDKYKGNLGLWLKEERELAKNGNGNAILEELFKDMGIDWP